MKKLLLVILLALALPAKAEDKDRLVKMMDSAPTLSSFLFAVKGLAELKESSICPKLRAKLDALKESTKDTDVDTAEELLYLLSLFKNTENTDYIYQMYGSTKNVRLKKMCIFVIGEYADPNALQELLPQLDEDENEDMKRPVVWALAKCGPPEIAVPLSKIFVDQHPSVRGAIALAIYRLKNKDAAALMEQKVVSESNPWVKEKLVWALKRLK